MNRILSFFSHLFLILTGVFFISVSCTAQQAIIPFSTDKWDLTDVTQKEFLGRPALAGTAYLKETRFENGVVEFDLAVTGQRSYPGVIFRMDSAGDFERIYIRPHLPPQFQNVIQYVSTTNEIDSWQLYTGQGNIASADIPKNEWFHVKVEFRGDQARIFLKNDATPALEIDHLGHGLRSGSIGLSGPKDGSAYFSNFSCREDNTLDFQPAPAHEIPYGVLTKWQLSQIFKLSDIDNEITPEAQGLKDLTWKDVQCRPDGIVDVSHFYARKGNAPDVIFARTIIESAIEENKLYAFGYSDIISIFLNGKLLFCGNSSYTSRDPSFQGIVGLNDYIMLPLKKGKNELMIALGESFGGWGFIFQDSKAIFLDKSLTLRWEIKKGLKFPESVVYDKKRDLIYVSNYFNDRKEFISKIKPNGEMVQTEWVTGILQPTGMCMNNDKLYIVERYALVEVDPDKGTILNRYQFPEPGMPNDVTPDDKGNLYITDSRKNLIYRLSEGKMEEWLKVDDIPRPNGICFDKGNLIVGSSENGCVKRIDLVNRKVSELICIRGAVIDGISPDGKGNLLISDFNGKVYRISGSNEKTLLLNSTAPSRSCADFGFIPDKGLLIIPTFTDNKLEAYEITGP